MLTMEPETDTLVPSIISEDRQLELALGATPRETTVFLPYIAPERTARVKTPRRLPVGLAFDHPMFPHGTLAGHRRGCRGADTCAGHPDTGATCLDADHEYQRHRRDLERGLSAEQGDQERAERPPVIPAGIAQNHPLYPHGTVSGYTRGCRDNCTSTTGTTCREARRAYDRKLHADKKNGPSA